MASVVHGKALVAKLRANPKVRDAEALAAWIGRVKRLRKAGVSPKRAKSLAGTAGGMKSAGVAGGSRKPTPSKQKPKAKKPNINVSGRKKGTERALKDADKAFDVVSSTLPNNDSHFNGTIAAKKGWGSWADWNGEIALGKSNFQKWNDPTGTFALQNRQTVVHEMFHMFSPGRKEDLHKDARLFGKMPGWEEAPVSMLTELTKPKWTADLDLDAETRKRAATMSHDSYEKYINPLEELREKWNLGEPMEFYTTLMSKPLAERPRFVEAFGNKKAGERQAEFFKDLQKVHANMKRGVYAK